MNHDMAVKNILQIPYSPNAQKKKKKARSSTLDDSKNFLRLREETYRFLRLRGETNRVKSTEQEALF